MALRFKANPAAGPELARTAEMMAFLLKTAQSVAGTAQAIAPRRTGAYASSITADAEPGRARVNANDFKAVWIEFGTGQPAPTPAFHVLSRAAESMGLRVVG